MSDIALSLDIDENKTELFTIRSNNGMSIEVDSNILRNSGLMQVVLQLVSRDKDCKEITLDLPYNLLLKSIEYLKHLDKNPPREIQKPVMDLTLKSVLSDWEIEFVDELMKEYELIFHMINAANYLGIPSLMDICMAKIASLIKFKKDEELTQTINKL